MEKANAISVLIVEDEMIVALNLSKELQSLGYQVAGTASSEDEAFTLVNDKAPTIVLMDINLEHGGSGISASKKIREISSVPIIYVTAYSSDKIIDMAGRTNPYGYILKPYNIREVKAVINTALVRYEYENKIQASEQRLKIALEAAELGVLEFDHLTQAVGIEDHSSSLGALGFKDNMLRQDFLRLFCDADAFELDELLAKGKPFNIRARINSTSHDTNHYVDVFISQILSHNSTVQIGAVQDVSDSQQNINFLRVSDSVLNQMQESVLLLDEKEHIKQVNPAFCRLIGSTKEALLKQPFTDFLLNHRQDDHSVLKLSDYSDSGRRRKEVTIKKADGEQVHAVMTVSDLLINGDPKQYVVTLTDVSRLVEAERNLNKIAYTDSLTGFGNRAYLNGLMGQLANIEADDYIALLFIDIDSFKNINDSLGHEIGDSVLIEFANRLRKVFREHDFLIRLGGDEFVVVLTGNMNKDSLVLIGNKVQQLCEDDFTIVDQDISVSCSLGIAFTELKNFEPKLLLKQADAAMYQAKKVGKNTFRFFDATIANETQYRIFIEQGLKSAIKNNEIMIYLQPVVHSDGSIKSAEALCRWYNEETGFISPEEFIPVAEESYLIQSLGLKVINESMIAKKQLNEAGLRDIVININFSEKQLQRQETSVIVKDLLTEYGLSADEFIIEITESTLHCNKSDATIVALRKLGFKFALDDFGTGYSSLSRLQDYSVDILKIDRSFTHSICTNTKQKIITEAIINLAQELDYKIIAEGVETYYQREALVQMGCHVMQGFYFAKPMPINEFIRYAKL